ncbi:MAG: O-antigen ligase family protein, partial [Clostridiaceae bacterium]|nr:O-antigen ligase family protein [Clostridiaceae bacterium]
NNPVHAADPFFKNGLPVRDVRLYETCIVNGDAYKGRTAELYVGGRVSGFVIGDNGAGNLGAILFPVLLYKYKKDKNVLNLSLILANGVFVIFTFTRIAYVAICVELLIYMLFSAKNSIKGIIKNIATFMVALGVGLYFYLNYINEIINILILQRGNTQVERFTQFSIVIKAFFSTPIIGTGHGQYNSYVLYKFSIIDKLQIHSQFLNMIVEEGIINFMLFAVFNIILIYMLVKKYKNTREMLYIIMIVVGNVICINFNTNQTYEVNNCIYYLILFGLLFAKDEIKT